MMRKALTTSTLALSLAALGTVPAHAVPIDLTQDVWVLDIMFTTLHGGGADSDAGGFNIEVPSEGDILDDDAPTQGPDKETGSEFGSL